MVQAGRIVIACYRPSPGKQAALRRLIVDHVARLRAEKLVTDRAPITMEAQDGTIVEVFEWASAAAIERAHANPAVKAMWKEFGEVCDYVPLASLAEAAEMFAELTPIEVREGLAARPARPEQEPHIPHPRNEFGDPHDTLYAGGTPLFDETGQAGPKGKRGR